MGSFTLAIDLLCSRASLVGPSPKEEFEWDKWSCWGVGFRDQKSLLKPCWLFCVFAVKQLLALLEEDFFPQKPFTILHPVIVLCNMIFYKRVLLFVVMEADDPHWWKTWLVWFCYILEITSHSQSKSLMERKTSLCELFAWKVKKMMTKAASPPKKRKKKILWKSKQIFFFFHRRLKDRLFNSLQEASVCVQRRCDPGSQGVGSVVRAACCILKGGRCEVKGGDCSRPGLGCYSQLLLEQQRRRLSPTDGGSEHFAFSYV